MGRHLNSITPYENYKRMANERCFVDKSEIIGELLPYIYGFGKYLCITRPRQFGKTVCLEIQGASGRGAPVYRQDSCCGNKL